MDLNSQYAQYVPTSPLLPGLVLSQFWETDLDHS